MRGWSGGALDGSGLFGGEVVAQPGRHADYGVDEAAHAGSAQDLVWDALGAQRMTGGGRDDLGSLRPGEIGGPVDGLRKPILNRDTTW